MKRNILVAAVATLCLSVGGMAAAQGRPGDGPGRDRDRDENSRQVQRPGPGYDRRAPQHVSPARELRDIRERNPSFGRDDGRGAGPDHNFRRGGRLPNEYRNRQYVVNDWRGHHLSPPPRGYNWVQTGGDYVLVAIATGVIAQILLGQ